jgi:hypothetical protein
MRCRTCNYDLRRLADYRCPECGCAFDPNDPNTFEDGGPRDRRWFWLSIIGGILFVMILLAVVDVMHSYPPNNGWTFWSAVWTAIFLTALQWVPLMLAVIAAGWLLRVILARFSRDDV